MAQMAKFVLGFIQSHHFMSRLTKFRRWSLWAWCWALAACSPQQVAEPVPFVPVNVLVDLNNIRYQALRFDRGFVYENGGVRGLILYRRATNTYLAFDRACTYHPNNSCGRVDVDASGFFLRCPCCSSVFDFDGNPTGAPAFTPLARYRTALSGSLLSVTN
jgi:nitrite reductase/ring-hydroxylating ferredoxin subunit